MFQIRIRINSLYNADSRWQKTPVANLVHHVQSSNYYARIRVRGKLIRKSLWTDRISVAKLSLADSRFILGGGDKLRLREEVPAIVAKKNSVIFVNSVSKFGHVATERN